MTDARRQAISGKLENAYIVQSQLNIPEAEGHVATVYIAGTIQEAAALAGQLSDDLTLFQASVADSTRVRTEDGRQTHINRIEVTTGEAAWLQAQEIFRNTYGIGIEQTLQTPGTFGPMNPYLVAERLPGQGAEPAL